MAEKKTGGRPPKYRSPKAMQTAIDAYFDSCVGEILRDDEGKPMVGKSGLPVMKGQRPPTMTGLALALGFADRSSLLDYKAKPRFEAVVRRAISRIEQYTEERLFDREGSAGARFSLQNNFKGWKQGTEVTLNTAEGGDVMSEIRERMARDYPGEEA